MTLGARQEESAALVLRAMLAEAPAGETIEVNWLTSAQQWAVRRRWRPVFNSGHTARMVRGMAVRTEPLHPERWVGVSGEAGSAVVAADGRLGGGGACRGRLPGQAWAFAPTAGAGGEGAPRRRRGSRPAMDRGGDDHRSQGADACPHWGEGDGLDGPLSLSTPRPESLAA